jgi:hypothetical protein
MAPAPDADPGREIEMKDNETLVKNENNSFCNYNDNCRC